MNEHEYHVQCKLTEQQIIDLRAATNKGTTQDAVKAACLNAIANMKAVA